MARILIWQDQRVIRNIPLFKSSILVGRSSGCEIQLDDPHVSDNHARITRIGATYYLEDLGSTNGVFLNKRKVEREALQDGDSIHIYTHHLQFIIDVEAEARAAKRLVEVQGVSKEYALGKQTVTALRNVYLSVFQGEFMALAGPSGSGKSTLLNIIGCIDEPTSGSVRILDEDMGEKSADALAELRLHTLGFIFQTFNLLPVLSAWENVEYPLLQLRDLDKPQRRERVEHYLRVVGLDKYMQHRPNELSGGQRQRVAIARALATKPRMILADEPTANLDRKTGEEILRLMKELNQNDGLTFLFSTHDHRVMEMADRVVELSDGQIVD